MKIRHDGVLEHQPVTDAAEQTGVSYAAININGSGPHTIVSVPAGKRFRVLTFRPAVVCTVPDITGDPVMEFTLGGDTIRGQILHGRWPSDLLGDDGEDFVITCSKAGQIDGTVAYVLEDS